jgi:hypothetical protein
MKQPEAAQSSTQTPKPRNVGSIPITRSPSQTATSAGKPGKTWEVGAPYIINQDEAPDWNHIVVCTHTDGRCRYLVTRDNRRWPHVMQLSERSTPLAAFGIVLWLSIGGIEGNQAHDSVAVYPDGKPRRWQAGKSNSMPLMAPEPKYWRLDPQVAPKLIKWIQGNPPAVQQAKAVPEPPLTATSLKILHKPDHDTAWESHFILGLASFMQKRGCQSVFVTVRDGQVGYEVTPVGESPPLYELVDATDEERYYPLGLFTNFATALRNASEHHPGRWEPVMDQSAFAEIRARKLGTSGGDYAVLWRGEWFYDYEATEWKLVEQQTGTLENPLPITRA